MKRALFLLAVIFVGSFVIQGCGVEEITLVKANASASTEWTLPSSGFEDAVAANACDGDVDTNWSGLGTGTWAVDCATTDEYWWQIDLGQAEKVSRVELDVNMIDEGTRQMAGGKEVQIQSSSDGTTFTAIAGAAGTLKQTSRRLVLVFDAVSTQYVRVLFKSNYGRVPCINEVTIYKSKMF